MVEVWVVGGGLCGMMVIVLIDVVLYLFNFKCDLLFVIEEEVGYMIVIKLLGLMIFGDFEFDVDKVLIGCCCCKKFNCEDFFEGDVDDYLLLDVEDDDDEDEIEVVVFIDEEGDEVGGKCKCCCCGC